jgi:predicted ABC-type transport system involved in lysophospholipase L1 biosynthesis ATPase subunit
MRSKLVGWVVVELGVVLSLEGVSKGYRRGSEWLSVLSGVSLEVGAGAVGAVFGQRFAGKTTLLKVAAGMVAADDGEVRLEGCGLTAMSRRERGQLLGREIVWLSREPPGLEWRVGEYVVLPLALGRSSRGKGRVAAEALELVGLAGRAGQRWSELSSVERVLVALARGWAARPRVLLLDDLFDGLEHMETNEVGDVLGVVVRELGCGALMSVSSPGPGRLADQVWSLMAGELELCADQASVEGGPGTVVDATRRFIDRR